MRTCPNALHRAWPLNGSQSLHRVREDIHDATETAYMRRRMPGATEENLRSKLSPTKRPEGSCGGQERRVSALRRDVFLEARAATVLEGLSARSQSGNGARISCEISRRKAIRGAIQGAVREGRAQGLCAAKIQRVSLPRMWRHVSIPAGQSILLQQGVSQ